MAFAVARIEPQRRIARLNGGRELLRDRARREDGSGVDRDVPLQVREAVAARVHELAAAHHPDGAPRRSGLDQLGEDRIGLRGRVVRRWLGERQLETSSRIIVFASTALKAVGKAAR